MVSPSHISFDASDRSYLALLKKEIHQLVVSGGFSKKKAAEADIVVAEIASNLIKHAGGGEILARLFTEDDNVALELISIDNGPGISNPEKMLEDGVSTVNTLGQGLGSIKRLSDTFQLYSLKGWGTIVLSRIYKNQMPLVKKRVTAEVRYINVPKPGERVCGDGVFYTIKSDRLTLFLADGLGHGPEANKAVVKGITFLQEQKPALSVTPGEVLAGMHKEVKRTRGLVGTIVVYDFKDKKWRFCGIGNISTALHNPVNYKTYPPYNGIIGMNIPSTIKDLEIPAERGQVLVMCSDGIRSRWDLQRYPGLLKLDLSIAAAAIYKDYGRRADDMSVVIGRINIKA